MTSYFPSYIKASSMKIDCAQGTKAETKMKTTFKDGRQESEVTRPGILRVDTRVTWGIGKVQGWWQIRNRDEKPGPAEWKKWRAGGGCWVLWSARQEGGRSKKFENHWTRANNKNMVCCYCFRSGHSDIDRISQEISLSEVFINNWHVPVSKPTTGHKNIHHL